MSEVELPSNFDWVKARVDCSPTAFFERLRLGAERNTKRRNDLRTDNDKQDGMKFSFTDDGHLFSVFCEGVPGRVVKFRMEALSTIHVESQGMNADQKFSFLGTLTLTDKAKCRLKVGDDELDEWQVLRRALEPLFFPA
jgi:hypothetical protein